MTPANVQPNSRFSPLDLRKNMRRTDELSYAEDVVPEADADPQDCAPKPSGQFSPTQERLSRFTACHTRLKPKPRVALVTNETPCTADVKPARPTKVVPDQLSNEGAEIIPLSVLASALPSRVSQCSEMDVSSRSLRSAPVMRQVQFASA
jgi:hypothetical protein